MLAVGGLMLYFGAEWLVGGASALAQALRVPPLIIGLTIVAYGTSTPEIIVGIQAAKAGYGDVALGNVIGSNIANVGLILGLSALVFPASVDGTLRRRELPLLLASTALLPLLLLDGILNHLDAGLLLLVAVGYTLAMVRSARTAAALAAAREAASIVQDAADAVGAPRAGGQMRSAAVAAVGLGVLLVGGSLFVDGAVVAAKALGMSERLIGLTIVAIGTSLPELVTSVVAARRGHSDIVVGNVIGSNIFNVLLCLGAAAMAGPVGARLDSLWFELTSLGVLTLVAVVLVRNSRTITRAEGAFALALYVAFLAIGVAKG